MIFLNANARYPGATHDAAIWEVSTINRHLKRRYMTGERNSFLIGDSGYPLQPWIMTPIPDAPPNSPEGIYTTRHCSARNIVERAFGVLKQRFRCLLKHRCLHYSHTAAGRIIYSCIILHNICRLNNLPEFDEENDAVERNIPNMNLNYNNDINDNNLLIEGRWVQRMLINEIVHRN